MVGGILVIPPAHGLDRPDTPRRIGAAQPANPSVPPAPTNVPGAARAPQAATPAAAIVPRVFLFEGNRIITTRELNAVVAPWIGARLDMPGLNRILEDIRNAYRQRGYVLATPFLPEQQVDGGVVRIGILEGMVGRVRIRQPIDPLVNITEAQVRSILDAHVKPGEPLSEIELRRAFATIEQRSGASVRSAVSPGAQSGTADLDLELVPRVGNAGKGPGLRGSVEADNFGNDSTGENRLALKLDIGSLATLGDRLSLQGFTTDKGLSLYGNARYTIPLGASGATASASIGKLTYSLGGSFAALQIEGEATVFEAVVTYPLVRSNEFNLEGRLAYAHKNIENRDNAVNAIQAAKFDSLQLQLAGQLRDTNRVTMFGLSLQSGELKFANAAATAADQGAGGYRTAGRSQKLGFDIQHLHKLGERMTLFVRGSGQFTNKNLSGIDKFSLGGPERVRGFVSGEGSGDKGYAGTVELRVPVPGFTFAGTGLQVNAFYDFGRVQRNADSRNVPVADRAQPNNISLQSYGVGLRFGRDERFMIRADLARGTSGPPGNPGDKPWMAWLHSVIWF